MLSRNVSMRLRVPRERIRSRVKYFLCWYVSTQKNRRNLVRTPETDNSSGDQQCNQRQTNVQCIGELVRVTDIDRAQHKGQPTVINMVEIS